jgi:hypothetical protein
MPLGSSVILMGILVLNDRVTKGADHFVNRDKRIVEEERHFRSSGEQSDEVV